MDTRKDRGDFYPGGETGGSAPAPQPGDKVDRVNVGEVGESYTLKDVKNKVNQIVRVIAPAAVGLMLIIAGAIGIGAASLSPRTLRADTAPLEDIPNTSPVVTNEEDAVALATLATATNALQSSMSAAMSELRSDMNTASNNLATAIGEAIASESNRVEATYAKRSEIPAAPDLSPYALKSELPADYLREGDITNFATRAWINSQGYATEMTVYARIDAQNLALGAATNELWQAMASGTNRLWEAHAAASNRLNMATNALWNAHRADVNALRATDTALSNRLNTATNALWNAHRAEVSELGAMDAALSNRLEQAKGTIDGAWRAGTNKLWKAYGAASNRLDAATNKLWQAARSESNRLERTAAEIRDEIAALELTGGMTRLWTSDAKTYQDATGVVWQVQVATSAWTVEHSWTTNGVDLGWSGPYWWGPAEGVDNDYYEGPGWYIHSGNLTPLRRSEDPYESQIVVEWEYSGEEAHAVTTTCSRTVQWLTNAVNRVAYTNELGAAKEDMASAMEDMEGRLTINIEALRGQAAEIGTAATNYTDAVAAEFENGTRQVESAQYAGSSSDAMFAYKVSGDNWNDQYNANDLMRASTNAARAVVAPVAAAATNYTDAATNALAQTIPQGGGMHEWREVNYDVEVDMVNYVTNGIASLTFINAGYAYGINVSTNGWPEGASMFVRGSFRAGATYTIPNDLRLIGYGTWPTNNFQSVWWRSGTNIYVNVILEEWP